MSDQFVLGCILFVSKWNITDRNFNCDCNSRMQNFTNISEPRVMRKMRKLRLESMCRSQNSPVRFSATLRVKVSSRAVAERPLALEAKACMVKGSPGCMEVILNTGRVEDTLRYNIPLWEANTWVRGEGGYSLMLLREYTLILLMFICLHYRDIMVIILSNISIVVNTPKFMACFGRVILPIATENSI